MSSPSAPPKKRIVSIQVCRGLAAMVVVLAHLDNVETKYFTTHLMNVFQYGVAGVDLFFVISGVVISSVTVGQFHSARNAARFLYHRFARVYPIFWIYSFIVLLAFLHNPHWINARSNGHVEVVRSFLLVPSDHAFLLMQGWTLSYEVYFYLIFFLLLLISTERLAPWLLSLWGLAAIGLVLFNVPLGGPVTVLMGSPLIIEFLAGCLIFQIYRRSRLHPGVGIALIVASLAWFAMIMVWTTRAHGGAPWVERTPVARAMLFGSFAALFLLGSMELERTGLVRFARPLVAIGDWSYSIYLTHIIVIELFGRMFYHFAPHLPYAILAIDAITIPLVLLVGYLSYTYVERPLTNLLYRPSRQPVPLRAT